MPDPTAVQFSTRDVPWMKLGTVIDKPVKAAQAMKLAGLDFKVERAPLAYMSRDGEWHDVENRSALIDPKTNVHYGTVGPDYEIVQFSEAFEFVDRISDGRIVAAGSLRKGKQAFMVVEAPESVRLAPLGDDAHELYIVLRTSHDCTKAIELNLMPLRGMCMNMMPLASFGRRARQRWSIRHAKTAREQMTEAHNAMVNLESYAAEYAAIADRLVKISVKREVATDLLEAVLPPYQNRHKQIDAITDTLAHGENVGHVNTGWGLVNAVGEYFEHLRNRGTAESRMLNALSGVTRKYINNTTQLLLQLEP